MIKQLFTASKTVNLFIVTYGSSSLARVAHSPGWHRRVHNPFPQGFPHE